jgi:hypothetical protein
MRCVFPSVLSFVLLVGATNSGAAQTFAAACQGAQKSALIAQLLFGRDIGDRVGVSDAAWRRFVAQQITPRFPDGLTIIGATGQWRDRAHGRIVREPSKLVMIVLPGKSDDQARLDAVVGAYKRRFHQQSVGVVVQPGCVSF